MAIITLGANAITALPAGIGGKVLQVVTSSYGTEVGSSSNVYADTGLTASITPSSASSTILVTVHQVGLGKETGNTSGKLKLLRDSTDLIVFEESYGYTNTVTANRIGGASVVYVDSPATTSSITYKTQFASGANTASAVVQFNSSDSTICLMEISA